MKKNQVALVVSLLFVVILLMVINRFYGKTYRGTLHGYVTMNIGLLEQKNNLEAKNEQMIVDFENQALINPKDSRFKAYRDNAIQIAKFGKEMNDYIEKMKIELVMKCDGVDETKAKDRVMHPFAVRRKGDYNK